MDSGEVSDDSSLLPNPNDHPNSHLDDPHLNFPLPFPAVRPRRKKDLNTSESSDNEESESGFTTSSDQSWEEIWAAINEKKVRKIDFHFFYQPRTLTLLILISLTLAWIALAWEDGRETRENVAAGITGVVILFLSIGLLIFPNGPFTRPHPLVWRVVFGLSLLYLLGLTFALFQHHSDVGKILQWIDPHGSSGGARGNSSNPLVCGFTLKSIGDVMDLSVVASFLGWVFKAMLVQHRGMLWTMNVVWECTQVFLSFALPNYPECWWDALLFDMPVCNGLGIHLGMYLCTKLEVTHFQRQSMKEIKGTRGKLKRAFLQLAPARFHAIRWPAGNYRQAISIFLLILLFQLFEMNTALLQDIFDLPPRHFLTFLRLLLLGLVAAPSVHQYYTYVLDTKLSKRLGTQSWLCIAILATETLICMKFGLRLFPRLTVALMFIWCVGVALVTLACVGLITTYTPWGRGHPADQDRPLGPKRKKRRKRRVYAAEECDKSN